MLRLLLTEQLPFASPREDTPVARSLQLFRSSAAPVRRLGLLHPSPTRARTVTAFAFLAYYFRPRERPDLRLALEPVHSPASSIIWTPYSSASGGRVVAAITQRRSGGDWYA
ncbi:hypothetical protein C8Q80DRAFT_1274705 [Daedaleopsis nitida]|nr:hypothetical protein C8Q80DRAFT_1274705 [Daedaleopsis nitida]